MTPIRKGQNPVKIPFPIKSTDRTFAAWANEVRTALQQLESRMPTANVGRVPGPASAPPPFCPRTVAKQPDDSFLVTIQEGHLVERDVISGEAMTYFDPDIADAVTETTIAISTKPRPKFAMALEDTAVLHYQTDEDGNVTGTPEIEAYSTVPESAHYQPENPEGESDEAGVPGDYYVKLFKITADGDSFKTVLFQQSDVEHYHEVPALVNIDNTTPATDEPVRVFKKRDIATGKMLFRNLISGQTGSLVDPSACKVEITENADTIEFKVFSELPTTSGGTDDVAIIDGCGGLWTLSFIDGDFISAVYTAP